MTPHATYDARIKLKDLFPTLDFYVIRSSKLPKSWVVGVRPVAADASGKAFVWMWTPMKGFPDDELTGKLILIA